MTVVIENIVFGTSASSIRNWRTENGIKDRNRADTSHELMRESRTVMGQGSRTINVECMPTINAKTVKSVAFGDDGNGTISRLERFAVYDQL